MSAPYAVLFPGQGSQRVGMGAELFEARPDLLVEAADRILGWPLREVCLDGPDELLTRTDRAQPALYALAFVLWTELAARLGRPPAAAAGHSLGEYTALAAAGVFGFEDGLRLVKARAEAMAEAVAAEPSGMAALLGAGDVQAAEAAAARRAEGGRLWVANFNAPGQVVMAGAAEDIDWLAANARRAGFRRAVKLKVAGAFHSPLMRPAAAQVEKALSEVRLAEPRFPVWANATGAPADAARLPGLLARQVWSPVLFSLSLQSIAVAGVEMFVHVGPGEVTAGMARRAVKGCGVMTVSSIAGAEEAAARLRS